MQRYLVEIGDEVAGRTRRRNGGADGRDTSK